MSSKGHYLVQCMLLGSCFSFVNLQSGSAIFSEHATSNLGNLSKYQPVGATTVQPSSVEGAVTEIIHVFVDALPHVPDHRRLPLFHHLLTTVGVEEYLHVALGLLVERQVVQASPDQQVSLYIAILMYIVYYTFCRLFCRRYSVLSLLCLVLNISPCDINSNCR